MIEDDQLGPDVQIEFVGRYENRLQTGSDFTSGPLTTVVEV